MIFASAATAAEDAAGCRNCQFLLFSEAKIVGRLCFMDLHPLLLRNYSNFRMSLIRGGRKNSGKDGRTADRARALDGVIKTRIIDKHFSVKTQIMANLKLWSRTGDSPGEIFGRKKGTNCGFLVRTE